MQKNRGYIIWKGKDFPSFPSILPLDGNRRKKWWPRRQWGCRHRELDGTASLRHHFPILAAKRQIVRFRSLSFYFKKLVKKESNRMTLEASFEDLQENHAVTVVAINKGKNGTLAVKWAIENLYNSRHSLIMLHVRTRRRCSTPLISITWRNIANFNVRVCVCLDHHAEMNAAMIEEIFAPSRSCCARKGVRAWFDTMHIKE